jgi:hypothetical protein
MELQFDLGLLDSGPELFKSPQWTKMKSPYIPQEQAKKTN